MFVDVINLLIAVHVVLVDKYIVYSVDFSMSGQDTEPKGC